MQTVRLEDGTELRFPLGMPVASIEREVRDFVAKQGGAERAPSAGPTWGQVGRTVDNVVRRAASGATLGFADEIAAGLNTVTGMAPNYDTALATERQRDQQFRQESPGLAMGAEVVGGILSPAARLLAPVRGGTMAANVGRGAAGGVVTGGAAGFGEGEGGFTPRLQSAGTGAVIGGVVGGALPPVLQGAGALGARVGQAVGAVEPETTARRLILRDVARDGLTPEELLARAQAGGKPEMIADLAGENVRQSAQVVARSPGAGRQIAADNLAGRTGAAQAERLTETVRRFVSGDDFQATMDDLMQRRRTDARPLYERSFRITVTPDEYGRVSRFVNDPIGQDAMQRGLRIIELEHLADGVEFNPAAFGVTRGEGGRWVPVDGQTPNMRLLDAVKRGYDNIVEGFRDQFGRLNLDQYGNAVNQARASYRNSLAEMFHPYRRALEAWSGPSQSMDALRLGRRLLDQGAEGGERSLREIERLGPGDREMARIGVAQALLDRLGSATDNAEQTRLNRIFMTPNVRNRVRALFDSDEEFAQFSRDLQREVQIAATNRTIAPNGGSPTMPMQERAADLRSPPSGPLATTLIDPERAPVEGLLDAVVSRGGGVSSTPMIMMQRARQAAAENAYRRNTDAMAPMLFTTDPTERARIARGLLDQAARDEQTRRALEPIVQGLLRGGPIAAGLLANPN